MKTWEEKLEARNVKQRQKQAQLQLQTEEMQMQKQTALAQAKPLPYVRSIALPLTLGEPLGRGVDGPLTSPSTQRRRASEPPRLTTHVVEKLGCTAMVKVGGNAGGGQGDEWEDVSVSDASEAWRERALQKRSQGARDPMTLQRSQSARAVAKPTNRRHWSYARTLADARETLDVGSDASFEELTAALEAGLSEVLQSNKQERQS